MDKAMDKVAKVIGVIVGMVLIIILRGFLISKFWMWFIIPVLNVTQISVAQGIGFSMMISLITTGLATDKDKKDLTVGEAIFLGAVSQGFLLFIGWVIHLCI